MKKHLIAVSIVALLVATGLSFLFFHIDFLPGASSTQRGIIDDLLKILFGIGGAFFGVIITFFTYNLIFFRRQPGDLTDGPSLKGNSQLEFIWTLIPFLVVIVLGSYAGIELNKLTSKDDSYLEVDVTAARFVWQFDYPAYHISSFVLELPVNQNVLFKMQSKDVVHSFWVQELGPKQDIVPGMTTELSLTPSKLGNFLLECSQLCGYGHTDMTAPVYIVSGNDFQSWIRQQQQKPPSSSTVPPSLTLPVLGTINLTADNLSFNLRTITVKAGSQVTINFENNDRSVPHNFALYTSSAASQAVFKGDIITGPAKTTYTFTAPEVPGNYFFRCDVHPTTMTGTFVVQ